MGLHLKDTIEGICRKAIEDKDGNGIPETYLKKTGDAKDNTVTFETDDNVEVVMGATPSNPSGTLLGYETETGDKKWHIMHPLDIKDKLSSAFNKFTTLFHNVRYLYELCGKTDISKLGDGTLTGVVSKLNTDLQLKDISNEIAVIEAGGVPEPRAYIENGSLVIYAYIPTGTKNSNGNLFRLPEKYAPRCGVCGSIGYASALDVGKVVNVGADTTGAVGFYIREALNYAVPFTIQYPLKRG